MTLMASARDGKPMSTLWWSKLAAALAVLLFSMRLAAPAMARDEASLAAAIKAANASGSATITLSSDITLSSALPRISGSLTIDGDGHTISGDEQFRIFDISGGSLTIKNATISGGWAETGGAIRMRNDARLDIANASLSDNYAETSGGAIAMAGGWLRITGSSLRGNSSGQAAGVIHLEGGQLEIRQSSFSHNKAQEYGGVLVAHRSRVVVENSTFHNNRADAHAVFFSQSSDLALTHLTLTGNFSASYGGDAISNWVGKARIRNSIIDNASARLDCDFGIDESVGNLVRDESCGMMPSPKPLLGALTGWPPARSPIDFSPAIDNADPDFCLPHDQLGRQRPQGAGCDIGAIESTSALPAPIPIEPPPPCPLALQIVAANTDAEAGGCKAGNGHDTIIIRRDIALDEPLPHISSDITIEGNGFTIDGGGRFRIFQVDAGTLTINNLTMTRGSAPLLNYGGGAIRLLARAKLIVNDSLFSKNFASAGGAIATYLNDRVLSINNTRFISNRAAGAGGAIFMNGGGTGEIENSSFIGNSAIVGGALDVTLAGSVNIRNSSFIGNRAEQTGGAIAADFAPVTMTHLTMVANEAAHGSGIHVENGNRGAMRLRNSLLQGAAGSDCYGRLSQNINNFIADGTCSPELSGLAMLESWDETSTSVALQGSSPAIKAADARYCTVADQLGNPRPQFGSCDIGALESTPVLLAVAKCQLTTTHTLNFRETPGGVRFGSVPENASMPASARTPGWFKVEYEGKSGWISADYVIAKGACD